MRIQLPFIILITLISMSAIQSVDPENPQMNNSLMMFYLTSLIFLPIYVGATIAYLESVVNEQPISTTEALKIGLTRWWPLLITKMLGAFGIVIGLFLFFIPGIYVLVRLAFSEYHSVIEKAGPTEALKNSWDDTSEFFWPLVNGLAVLFVILLGGNLLLEALLQVMGIDSVLLRSLLDIVFGFLNCLYTVYGFRLYCVMREKQSG
ncbi:YciC family protein [Amphritea sp.]|uniref:YciC family protein n=1 Tax=Amphritea sp. TaxID=1872502 RepID=UPI0025C44903|nr:YciC family protein [Amphritea sp.]